MTEDLSTATAQSGVETARVLDRALETARTDRYEGYSKHDGLNSPVLARSRGRFEAAPARSDSGGDAQSS